ncbi:MAG TPA: hypothetical protein VK155_04660 [Bacteroidales bacterium]|nr:hypothetical protein [Bacteroidales bacterium]
MGYNPELTQPGTVKEEWQYETRSRVATYYRSFAYREAYAPSVTFDRTNKTFD